MSNLAEIIEKAEKENKKIDYISVKTDGESAFGSVYFDNVKSADGDALKLLRLYPALSFLLKKNNLLFYTTQKNPQIEYSYEYKPKNLKGRRVKKFCSLWTERSGALIRYFAKKRRAGKLVNQGVWFFGIERGKDTFTVLKAYFKCFFENEKGDKVFYNDLYKNVCKNCGDERFAALIDKTFFMTQNGFNLYMIAFNENKKSGEIKYKLYYSISGDRKENPKTLLNKLGVNKTESFDSAISALGKYRCVGFTVSSGEKNGVNFYFKGE